MPEQENVGLFGYGYYATIQELGLENVLIEGKNYVGGLMGYGYYGLKIENGYVTGSVSGGSRIGGLVGYQTSGTISRSYVAGVIEGNQWVGGLVGYQGSGTINQSYATGKVSGNYYIGGLVGYQSSGTISESYTTGEVYGTEYVGGLIGQIGSSGTVRENYSTGLVVGAKSVGGFAGSDFGSDSNNYWDMNRSGQNSSPAAYAVLSEGLSNELTYFLLDGFDFNEVWILCEGETPQLRWQVDSCQEIERLEFSIEGTGETSNPYIIFSEEDLFYFSKLMSLGGKYYFKSYLLESDIDFSNYDTDNDELNGNWMPLGTETIPFKGVFDGDGYAISNFKIILPEQNYVGFFGYTDYAKIKNLGLKNVIVEGNCYVGGLVGYQTYGNTVENVFVEGNISGSYYIGGVVGYQKEGKLRESYSTGNVSGVDDVGGLVGYSGGKIEQTYSMSNVNGSRENTGGLIGYLNGGTISGSYATGNVSGKDYVGGLVGYQSSSTTPSSMKIIESYATGDVSGYSKIGGLVGWQGYGPIERSYAVGKVSGSNNVGGLVGSKNSNSSYKTDVIDSYWNIETSEQNRGGGGIGLTTKQMTKRKVKEHMLGFDFENVWQLSNGYPRLHWQTPDPIIGGEEDLNINGNIEATILALTIPSDSMTFVLNPNEEVGKQFVASDFELINGSQTPLILEIKSFEQVTDTLNDVEPTKYDNWTGLNKTQSKDIALALAPKTGDGWLILNEGNRWVANLEEPNIGTIKGNSTVSFGFEAKHGSAFTETLNPQYELTFIFGLQD